MVSQVVCKENDIGEGELKEFPVGSIKVLVCKYQGKLSAVSSKCTHYGAPLITGAYKDGKIRCPWHGACFSAVTGDIEDYPGLDSLHQFKITVENGDVTVTITEEAESNFRHVKSMANCRLDEVFLIIGGGGAAMVCAETLRQQGYEGKIKMATAENHPPYDRPKLSKVLNAEASTLYLRKPEFLKEHNIELLTNKKATVVDTKGNTVTFADGSTIVYKKLFIATGGVPRMLKVPGKDLKNIFYLRSPEDANKIHEESKGRNVVVLGTGFIGMEMASYLASKAATVTVVGSGRTKVPFEKLLGEKIGRMYVQLHEEKGVKFCLQSGVKEITGENGVVKSVLLHDGTAISADVVISGIGVEPSTSFVKNTDIKLDTSSRIIVDKHMRTSVDNVYAGGDIVVYPNIYENDLCINIGHWQLASAHGRCAAMNMLGKETPIKTVPFFWTQQYGKSLRYTGHCTSFDEILYEGNVDELKFAAYYIKNGKVQAMCCLNYGAKASEMAFQIESGNAPTRDELKKLLST